ncbi:hypothetical protein F2P81_022990 [Scophthalmus maximus]|uniref:Uncharacterized protein n=2 Tax=Scophthalmus maximus TaxID=52904 RepID=A0A6A4RW89_SCOMX|nr:hypothetical protein F2P81_022990 [Scophthalmus maximus]
MAEMVGVGEEPGEIPGQQEEEEEEEELTKVEDVTLTLEPVPCSLTPSPLREEAPSTARGSSPGLSAQSGTPVKERILFDVTPCVIQSLEEETEEGAVVFVATN